MHLAVQQCGEPPIIPNATVEVGSYDYLSTANYTCNWLYIQTGGSSVKTCDLNQTWSGEDIVCQGEIPFMIKVMLLSPFPRTHSFTEIDCGPPPVVPNATAIVSHQRLGGNVRYECLTGYTMDALSAPVIYCLETNMWEDPQVTCEGRESSICRIIQYLPWWKLLYFPLKWRTVGHRCPLWTLRLITIQPHMEVKLSMNVTLSSSSLIQWSVFAA